MKTSFSILLTGLLLTSQILIFSCHRTPIKATNLVKATLLGADLRACPACGGYYLNLLDDTQSGVNTLRAIQYPDNWNKVALSQYPIKVYISYRTATNYHFPDSSKTIEILSIYGR